MGVNKIVTILVIIMIIVVIMTIRMIVIVIRISDDTRSIGGIHHGSSKR